MSNEHKTNNEEKMNTELKAWLEDFNNNKIVESVAMGEIGKGYEEAIQTFAVEMIKNLVDIEPIQDMNSRKQVIEELMMKVVNKLQGGYSGAQVNLATNIAVVFWIRTPEVGLQMMREDEPHRIIKIQKSENGVTWLKEPVNE